MVRLIEKYCLRHPKGRNSKFPAGSFAGVVSRVVSTALLENARSVAVESDSIDLGLSANVNKYF